MFLDSRNKVGTFVKKTEKMWGKIYNIVGVFIGSHFHSYTVKFHKYFIFSFLILSPMCRIMALLFRSKYRKEYNI
jgi:hypothetical protein